MGKHEDEETLERQVRLWLERMGIPQREYENLGSSDKVLLRDRICKGPRPLSDLQLRRLYQKLHVSENRAEGGSADAVDSMTNEKLQKFFSPLPHDDELPYLYKF